MSRLDLNPLGSSTSIELVMPAVRLAGSVVRGSRDLARARRGQETCAEHVFEQYLDHASQTVDLASTSHSYARPTGRAGTGRPSRPEPTDPKPNEQDSPAPEANDDPAHGTSPSSPGPNQSTTAETQSDDDQQAAGSDAESNANEEVNEQGLQSAGDAAVVLVEFVDVEAPSMPAGAEEVHLGDFLPEENFAGQPQAAEQQSVATSDLSTGEPLETDQPEVETTTPESPTTGVQKGVRNLLPERPEGCFAQDTFLNAKESAVAGDERAEGPPDVSGSAHSEPLDPAAPAARQNESQGDSRSVAERAGDAQLSLGQESRGIGPKQDSPNEVNADSGKPATGPAAAGQSEGQTAAPTPAWSSQGVQQTSSARDQETSGGGQVDRVRFVQRVAGAFQAAGGSGESVRLRLYPPELGSLHLEVSVKGGSMTARLEVETNAARTMLLDNLPALRDRLAEQEIKVGRFDVELADHSADGSPHQPAQHPQSHDHPHHNATNTRSDYDPEPELPATRVAVSQPGEGSRLDVVI